MGNAADEKYCLKGWDVHIMRIKEWLSSFLKRQIYPKVIFTSCHPERSHTLFRKLNFRSKERAKYAPWTLQSIKEAETEQRD